MEAMSQTGSHHNSIVRYIAGYIVGIGVFMMLIPYTIWSLSLLDYQIFRIPIIPVDKANIMIAAPIFIIGSVFVVWSNLYLLLKGKGGPTDIGPVSVSPRTGKLVTDGPYKHSRNPMVFGTHSIYLSITLYLNSLGGLIVVAMFFLIIVKYALVQEEGRLLRDFGDEYLRYRERTSMILPLPSRNIVRVDE